jgi:hypothetical protein
VFLALQGILLIFVRKPYDIGDRVSFVDPTDEVNNNGPPSGGWIVEKVDLYTTTVRLATTREYTTFANGSLADSRIVNLKRSDKANVFFNLKFPINTSSRRLKIFRSRITQWIQDRPREWIKVNAFLCTSVQTELQYVEYTLILQHREAWQNFAAVQNSRSDVFTFALDLQRELKMKYMAPRMPIDLHGFDRRNYQEQSIDTTPVSRKYSDGDEDDSSKKGGKGSPQSSFIEPKKNR